MKSPIHPLTSSATHQFNYLATHATLTVPSSTNKPLNPSNFCVFFIIPFGTCTSCDLDCKRKSEDSQLPAYLSILCGIGNLAKLAAIEVTWRIPVLAARAITSFLIWQGFTTRGSQLDYMLMPSFPQGKKRKKRESPPDDIQNWQYWKIISTSYFSSTFFQLWMLSLLKVFC